MHLENILLALLADPSSGYDLKRAFDGVINYFWQADIAQVYRTLQRMEAKGLLKSKEVVSEQGPPRKVYRRTALGRKQVFAWLRGGPDFGTERHTYVAQWVFHHQLDDLGETLRFARRLRDSFAARLELLRGIEAEEPTTDVQAMSHQELGGYLGLQLGIETTASRVAWCEQTIKILEARLKREKE